MNKKKSISLSQNLRHLIKEHNTSVNTIAKKVGMNKATLHNYCNGTIPRSLISIQKLADFLGISINELLFGPDKSSEDLSPPTIEGKYELTIKHIGQLPIDSEKNK